MYTTRKCISCSKAEDFETELFEIFDDIYYCGDCVDKFKLNKPRKVEAVPPPDTIDDVDDINFDIWGDT